MASLSDRASVRTQGRAARQAIQGKERTERERSLFGHLSSLHALTRPSIGVFVAHDGEPDLTPLVELLWQREQQVALPVLEADPADHGMHFRNWAPGAVLESGRYDIAAPPRSQSHVVHPDCLLVSLTAFDGRGNRMGRGGGFFDRYLATADCQIVGVGFETQRVPYVPTQPHDVAMPIVVTDFGVRFFS